MSRAGFQQAIGIHVEIAGTRVGFAAIGRLRQGIQSLNR